LQIIEPKPEIEKSTGPAIKQGWVRALIFLIVLPLFLVVQSLALLILMGFQISGIEDYITAFDKPVMILAQGVSLILTLVYVWVFRRFIDRRSLVSLGLEWKGKFRKDLVMGLVWGAGMATVVFGLYWLFGLIQIQRVQFPLGSMLVTAVTLLFAAAQEELLLRGYLLNNLMQSANKYLSLLLVSVIFSAGHGMNPNLTIVGLLNIVLAGLVLGIYYVNRRNLWFPIGLHLAWNWFQGVVYGSPVSGMQIPSIFVVEITGNEDLSGGGFGFEGSLIMTVVAVLAIVLLYFIYRQSPDDSPVSTQPAAGEE